MWGITSAVKYSWISVNSIKFMLSPALLEHKAWPSTWVGSTLAGKFDSYEVSWEGQESMRSVAGGAVSRHKCRKFQRLPTLQQKTKYFSYIYGQFPSNDIFFSGLGSWKGSILTTQFTLKMIDDSPTFCIDEPILTVSWREKCHNKLSPPSSEKLYLWSMWFNFDGNGDGDRNMSLDI